jgi:hypothetical protein
LITPETTPHSIPTDPATAPRFEEPIPLPDEMAAKAAQGYYHDFLSPLDLPKLALDASDSGRVHLGLISEIPVRPADVEEFLAGQVLPAVIGE